MGERYKVDWYEDDVGSVPSSESPLDKMGGSAQVKWARDMSMKMMRHV